MTSKGNIFSRFKCKHLTPLLFLAVLAICSAYLYVGFSVMTLRWTEDLSTIYFDIDHPWHP